jgi:hypothetical protein
MGGFHQSGGGVEENRLKRCFKGGGVEYDADYVPEKYYLSGKKNVLLKKTFSFSVVLLILLTFVSVCESQ